MNLFEKRFIKNFDPNKKTAWFLSKKRLSRFLAWVSLFCILAISGFLMVWFLVSKNQAKIYLLVIISVEILQTIIYFLIYDNGAANKLKKQNFKIKGIKNIEQAHTYYYSLKQSGFLRLIINGLILIIFLILVILVFL